MSDRARVEAELDEEMQDHLAREIESNIASGMSPDEARSAAQRLVGSVALYTEECRDARSTRMVDSLVRDLRYAVRTLRRTPLFTLVAVATLALGIGANTTVYTFVDTILMRSLPARQPDQLVALNWGGMVNISYPNYVDFRGRNGVFSYLAACRYNPANVSVRGGENFRVWGYEASGNYFEMLEVQPFLGRFFTPAEDASPGANPVVIISHRFWQSRLGEDRNVVGRVIKINGRGFTVTGVAPSGFTGTELLWSGDYWVPMSMEQQIEPGTDWLHARGDQNVWVLGRLKSGVSHAQAEANLNQIAGQLAEAYPELLDRKMKFQLSRPGLIGQALRGPITNVGVVLMALALAGLLLACVNLAGMLLARASDRRREIGIRLALGASRLQLVRQMMTESFLLALSGGVIGVGVAWVACGLFSSLRLDVDIPIESSLHPDVNVMVFALGAALSSTLLFGLVPALQGARADVVPSLKGEPSQSSRRWRGWRTSRVSVRDMIVVGQLALSLILVTCSVLVVRSLQHALTLNLGFNPDNAVAVSFDLRMQGYSGERSRHFDADLTGKISKLPGIECAGIINAMPLSLGGENNSIVSRVDRPVPRPAERRAAVIYNITPDYLRAAGTKLLSGRTFDNHDREGAPAVAVINDAAAQWLFPNKRAVGNRIRFGTDPADPGTEVVGVVETGKYESIGEDTMFAVFRPVSQTGTGWTTLIIRSQRPANQVIDEVRRTVLDLDPELTLFHVGSVKDQLALPLFPARIVAVVLGVFGVLAMMLAAIGLFALMAYTVSRRTHEIGIRIALGAGANQILAAVFTRMATIFTVGLAIGTIVTLIVGKLLSAVLYGVSPHDPVSYIAAVLLLIAVAIAASWNPAARAIRTQPSQCLREQ